MNEAYSNMDSTTKEELSFLENERQEREYNKLKHTPRTHRKYNLTAEELQHIEKTKAVRLVSVRNLKGLYRDFEGKYHVYAHGTLRYEGKDSSEAIRIYNDVID